MGAWQADALRRDESDEAETLAVLVHGLGRSAESLGSVADATREALGKVDVYAPRLAYAGLGFFTTVTPAGVICALADDIDALNQERAERRSAPYSRIILVGHSLGALVARKLTVAAFGETVSAPFERCYAACAMPRAWAGAIDRVVLIAGISKGWSPRSASSWLTSTIWTALAIIGTLTPARRGIVLEARMGLPFPVQTRLEWLALMREKRAPPVVQLLGSRDDLVAPDDMIDLAVDGDANDAHVLLEMPDTDHAGAVMMDGARRTLFMKALRQSFKELAEAPEAVLSALMSDGSRPFPDAEVTDVAFVIHGIRDKGFWTQKVARAIKREAYRKSRQLAPPQDQPAQMLIVRSMTESYGYLAMLPFVWVGVRRAKTGWLMDRFVEARARYPAARFHYIGHSNGTYLAARALRDYPAAQFDKVVFAGSVVRIDYDWRALIEKPRPQVRAVLNYVATGDLVVAIFPSALGLVDLGGAGHRGFRQLKGAATAADAEQVVTTVEIGGHRSCQVTYVRGGHGAGMKESQWDEIADFIVHDRPPPPGSSDYRHHQAWLARLLGAVPPFGLAVVATLFALLAWALYALDPRTIIPLAIVTVIVLLRA